MNIHIQQAMNGLGDTIYEIGAVELLVQKYSANVYIPTSWPQLWKYSKFSDNIFPIRPPHHNLRTQCKNMKKYDDLFFNLPDKIHRHITQLSYSTYRNLNMPYYQGLCKSINVEHSDYHLDLRMPEVQKQNIAIIRPSTIRTEWSVPARSARQKYIQLVIDYLEEIGIETWVLADVDDVNEKYQEFRPMDASKYIERGEMSIDEIIQTVLSSKILISGVGWAAPFSMAWKIPAIIIHGGMGGFNHSDFIHAPGAGSPIHILPDKYCMCKNKNHACDKTINEDILIESLKGIIYGNEVA